VGTVYVEFNVADTSLVRTGEGWAKIIGSDSLEGRLAARKGNPIPEMPDVDDVKVKVEKSVNGIRTCSKR